MGRLAPRLCYISLVVAALAFCPAVAFWAQSQAQQGDSVAEAARKARERKKEAGKPGKVWTNDNLNKPAPSPQPSQSGGASAGQEATSGQPSQETAPAAAEGVGGTPAESPDAAKERAELDAAKQQLAEAQKGLDLAQRDFDLYREQFYSNPSFQSDTKGRAQLDALQHQIADKKQEVQRLKEKVASLEAKVKS